MPYDELKITQQDRVILECWLESWDDSNALLPGNVNYQEVYSLIERLGLKKPVKLTATIKEAEKLVRQEYLRNRKKNSHAE